MSNIISQNPPQSPYNERLTFNGANGYAVPAEKGLSMAAEVINDFGGRPVSLEEVEGMVQAATKAPVWAQEKALGRIRQWLAQNPSSDLKGRVRELDQRLKFIQMASKAIEQAYTRMEDLGEQTLELEAGSGEIYLDHLIAVASALPTLSKAMAIEGDFDQKWALSDVKNIQWSIDDEGRDLIKAIRPEIRRAKKEYAEGEDEDLRTHLRLIGRMKSQVAKLYWIADHLEGPLKETGEILRRQAKEIEEALGELGDVPEGSVSSDKERRKAFFERRMNQKKYKELTGEGEEKKSRWAAWLFLGLQALTLLRGAGSVLLGHETAKLKVQTEQMQRDLFSKVDPEIKSDIEKDAARMGAILSDKWDALKKSNGGSIENALLRKLSPEAQEAIRRLVKGLDKAPTSKEIQLSCDAVMQNRLAEHIPGPFHHLSIAEWVELFLKQEGPEAQAPVVSQIAAEVLQSLDTPGPAVNKGLLLHVAGREFGSESGLEGYYPDQMLSYVRELLTATSDQKLVDKMGLAQDLGSEFVKLDPVAFRARLDKELSAIPIGENLFWQGGWASHLLGGHSIIYEVVKVGEDDFTFRVYNQGAGVSKYHTEAIVGLKQTTLTMHEVVEIQRENLLRPVVIQGLQELLQAPKRGGKWDPGEMYYNVLGRMNGKISNRVVGVDQTLADIYVGICSFSSLSAFLHQQLGSDKLYDRTMIKFEAKATWDYWLQHKGSLSSDRQGRELLLRSARQTIQDAIHAARPERNSLSNEELDLIRSRMEEVIKGVRRAEQLEESTVHQVGIQSRPSDLLFSPAPGTYLELKKSGEVAPALQYNGIDISKVKGAGEVARELHRGNNEKRFDFVRMAAQEYVRGISLDEAITPKEALPFVSDLVQIASEFQRSLHSVFTSDKSRTYRLPIKDAMVVIKLLTIADSIARQHHDTVGIALPDMLQQQMAVILYGMTAYSRVDDPALEDDIAKIRNYWNSVDPQGKIRGAQILVNRGDSDEGMTPSLFGFEWAPAGLDEFNEDFCRTSNRCTTHYISEDLELARKVVKPDDGKYWGLVREWPLIKWTLEYLGAHPEKLKRLIAEEQRLLKASPKAIAVVALALESGRTVLPEMFFHLWDLSFITNYFFTGGWNSENVEKYAKRKTDARVDQRPTRHFTRKVKKSDEGDIYYWSLEYMQFGQAAGDHAQHPESKWLSTGPQYVLPGYGIRQTYGEHDAKLRNIYGATGVIKERDGKTWDGTVYRLRQSPKERALLEAKDFPRETAQRLFGLSSKADLQIEETLAFFQANLATTSKPEYRALLSYMLFEQGLFLEEIKKRKPAELVALIETISSLTNKGHEHFAKRLGNIEIGVFFLDIAAKAKRYLAYAGVVNDFIADPVPKLREHLKDPSLSKTQRSSLRFILAKTLVLKSNLSLDDLADIVASAIQYDLHPIELSPFDDEIRRDLLISVRSQLYHALSGPDRDRLLNTILQMETNWHAHGDFPLYQSDDGKIIVNVLQGSYYERGMVVRSLPNEFCEILKKKQFAKHPEELHAIQIDDSTFEVTLPNGRLLMVKKDEIKQQIGEQWYQLQDNLSSNALSEGNRFWYYQPKWLIKPPNVEQNFYEFTESDLWLRDIEPKETLIEDIKTGRYLYRIHSEATRAIVHKLDQEGNDSGLVMARVHDEGTFAFLTAFEDPSWIRVWVDEKSGKLDSIELPRFDLSFTPDEQGRVNCNELPGYFLSPKQENYLVFDRIDRNQHTHQVIALPLQPFANLKEQALDPLAIPERSLDDSKQRYALYDVDGMSDTLIPRTIEGRFHLAMVYLWKHNYSRAAELIRGYGGQRSAYTEKELKLLDAICKLDRNNNDHTPQARAVRMIAHAARIRNNLDFAKGDSSLTKEDYQRYLHQLDLIGPLALTEVEEKLIMKQLDQGRPSAGNTTVGVMSPNFQADKEDDNKNDHIPGLLRAGLNWDSFFTIYKAITAFDYRLGYHHLTGAELPPEYSGEPARHELLGALNMITVGGGNLYARILSHALAAEQPLPSPEELTKVVHETEPDWKDDDDLKEAKKKRRESFFAPIFAKPVNPRPEIQRADGPPSANSREPIVPRDPPIPLEPEQAYQHSLRLVNKPALQGPVLEGFISTETSHAKGLASVTAALAKIFHVETNEPLANAQLAGTIRGIQTFGDSPDAKPSPHYKIKDMEGLRRQRLAIEQELFVMTGTESTAAMKLLGTEGANRFPVDPTLRAKRQAALASGDISPITLDDLALALINRNQGVGRIKTLNPGLTASEIDHLIQETMNLLIHATERRRRQAVVDAIKDLEKGVGPQELSNLAEEVKNLSEATRQFDPAVRPEYLVFEYYIGLLLQARQVAALDKLLSKVVSGKGIHTKELSNVLEMIMGSGKTDVLTVLIAWLEANGEQISLVVMPEGLMPDKAQKLEQRFGKAFSRGIDVLTFDRDSNFDEAALQRLLDRLAEARLQGKLVMVSSSSLQGLFLRFIEDTLNLSRNAVDLHNRLNPQKIVSHFNEGVLKQLIKQLESALKYSLGEREKALKDILKQMNPQRIDLFRQVLAELRKHGSIAFDELDVLADVLKLLIFSMEQPGIAGERQSANAQMKEATADLIKLMVSDEELAPVVAKPFTADIHESQVKPRLLEAILQGRVGPEDNELNRFIRTLNDTSLLKGYLTNSADPECYAFVDRQESMTLKNTLAVLKYQINKMIPETFSKRVDEHYSLVKPEQGKVDEETKLLSKPLEKGSWEPGSEHGTPEEGINYTLHYYLAMGVPLEFVLREVFELRDKLLSLEADQIEASPFFAQLMALTGGKWYSLERIEEKEIEEITSRINNHDPVQIVNLAMKYAVNPQLKVFPYQLRADAQLLFVMAMLTRGFSGTLWNWQTFDAAFKSVELSDTEAKTLHLLYANSPHQVIIVDAEDWSARLDQLFQGKSSVAIADVGNMFGDVNSEQVARQILDKGSWNGAPYYDDAGKLMVALRNRASESLSAVDLAKEDLAPYWKQELCTGSDIPLGTTAEAVVTFGRYTMMRDLLQTVWRLRKLHKGQKVRFAVAEADRTVIIDTLERLSKQKIEQLELSHLLLYAAYTQAMRIGDDNHRALGQQLRAQLIGEILSVIVQPEVTPEQVLEIVEVTQDLYTTVIDPNPYNRYGTRESMQPAQKVVQTELEEILQSKPMAALRTHPILMKYCEPAAIEKRLRATVEMMLPRMASQLAEPVDTGLHLKVKTKTKTQSKAQTKTQTQVQLRAAVHKKRPELPAEVIQWTEEALFNSNILKPIPAFDVRNVTINNLPGRQVSVADALGHYHPIAKMFDPRLLTSLNRMPIYTPRNPEKQLSFVPYDEYEDPVTNHVLLIEDKQSGQIGLMLLDQDDTSDIQELLVHPPENKDAPRLALVNLVTDKIWRQSGDRLEFKGDFLGLKVQAKLVNGMLSYTDEQQRVLLQFLQGKDVKAIREWFTQIIIGNRQRSLEQFPHSDLAKVFRKAIDP